MGYNICLQKCVRIVSKFLTCVADQVFCIFRLDCWRYLAKIGIIAKLSSILDHKLFLEYVHMYANDVRFANAIFMVQWIYVELFTYIRLRFASSDGRFAAPIFSVGERKMRIRMHICIDFYCRIG